MKRKETKHNQPAYEQNFKGFILFSSQLNKYRALFIFIIGEHTDI